MTLGRRPTMGPVRTEIALSTKKTDDAAEKTNAKSAKAAPRKVAKRTIGTTKTTTKLGAARPRIRASHSAAADGEGPAPKKKPKAKIDANPEVRRAKVRATVSALGGESGKSDGARAAKKSLGAPAKREVQPPRKRAVKAEASSAARELAIALASAGLDKKAIGVEVIDVSGRVDYADFLVIMTGTSDRHVHAIAMGLEEALKKQKRPPLAVEGLATCAWVLMDFDDVVVHVFQEDTRKIYDIEGIWIDAGRLPVPNA